MSTIYLATEEGRPIDFFGTLPAYVFRAGYTRVSLDLAPNADGIHDIHIDQDSSLALAYDADAVGQHARQRVKTFAEEWFLDTTCGIPWTDQIMGRQYDAALAEAVVKREITQTDGVTGIETFSIGFDRTTRGISIRDVSVNTEYDQEVSV